MRDASYEDLFSNDTIRDKNGTYTVREAVKPTIWIWCKALDGKDEFNDYSIFDLSPFVNSYNVSKDSNGGNFTIELTPVNGILEFEEGILEGFWSPDKNSYIKFKNNGKDEYVFREFIESLVNSDREDFSDLTFGQSVSPVDNSGVFSRDRKFKKRSNKTYVNSEKLFKNLILQNDVVFISDSASIKRRDIKKRNEFFIHSSEIPEKNWDMIGLIDNCSVSNNYESVESNINANGRDLMKLLIEDGSYFFTKSFADSESDQSIFKNISSENKGDKVNTLNNQIEKGTRTSNRLITTGIIDILYNPEARNVNFIMNLLMSRLSNVEIAPSELFKHYGDKRTEYVVATYEEENKESEKTGSKKENLD
jgi:hypothetical protein